jgi:hypothetical protein
VQAFSRCISAVTLPHSRPSRPVGSSPSDDEIPNTFTGEVNWVEIDVGATAAAADHQIDPDELLRVAMAKQQRAARTREPVVEIDMRPSG